MRLTIGAEVERDGELLAHVREASRFLEREAGPRAGGLEVGWAAAGDRVELRAADGEGRTARATTRAELAHPPTRELFVLRAWGDLLAARSKRTIARIGRLTEAGGREEVLP